MNLCGHKPAPARTSRPRSPWRAAAVAALVWFAGDVLVVSAGTTWMSPDNVEVAQGTPVAVTITTADEFGAAGAALVPSRIARVEVFVGGQPAILTPVVMAGPISRFTTVLPRPGVAVIEMELNPEARSISRTNVEQYLRQLHATDETQAAWEQIAPPNPWQEVRTLLLRTYARVGQPPTSDRAWSGASRPGFDLVPDQDPTSLKAGQSFAVRAARDGRPCQGVVVEYLSRGESRQHVMVTDAKGHAEAPLEVAGDWLIRAFDVQRTTAGNHDWDLKVVALTVRPQ